MTAHGVKLDTLKDCFKFLQWLKNNGDKQGQVTDALFKRIATYYNNPGFKVLLPDSLNDFLRHVSELHDQISKNTDLGDYKKHSADDIVKAFSDCLPKVHAALSLLLFHVDYTYGGVGGGTWKEFETQGNVSLGNGLKMFFTGFNGVIDGGFKPDELQNVQGKTLAENLNNALKRTTITPDLFTSVLFNNLVKDDWHDLDAGNVLLLLWAFCGYVQSHEKDNHGLKEKLQEELRRKNMCFRWQALVRHCKLLEKELSKLFGSDENQGAFSTTGRAFDPTALKPDAFAGAFERWFTRHWTEMTGALEKIRGSVEDFAENHAEFTPESLYPYGIVLNKDQRDKWPEGLKNLHGVLDVLGNSDEGDLKTLKDILNGYTCPAQPPPKKPEVTKAEAAKPTATEDTEAQNQGKKADGTPNQGKKAEGAQNQGKKSEGAQNQGKKSEGTPNQSKDQSDISSSDSASGDSAAPASPSGKDGAPGKPGPSGPAAPASPKLTTSQVQQPVQPQQPLQPQPQQPPLPPPPPPLPGSPGKPGLGGPGSSSVVTSSQQPIPPPVTSPTQSPSVGGPDSGPAGGKGAGQDGGKGVGQPTSQDADHSSSSLATASDTTAAGGGGSGQSGVGGVRKLSPEEKHSAELKKILDNNEHIFKNQEAKRKKDADYWEAKIIALEEENYKKQQQQKLQRRLRNRHQNHGPSAPHNQPGINVAVSSNGRRLNWRHPIDLHGTKQGRKSTDVQVLHGTTMPDEPIPDQTEHEKEYSATVKRNAHKWQADRKKIFKELQKDMERRIEHQKDADMHDASRKNLLSDLWQVGDFDIYTPPPSEPVDIFDFSVVDSVDHTKQQMQDASSNARYISEPAAPLVSLEITKPPMQDLYDNDDREAQGTDPTETADAVQTAVIGIDPFLDVFEDEFEIKIPTPPPKTEDPEIDLYIDVSKPILQDLVHDFDFDDDSTYIQDDTLSNTVAPYKSAVSLNVLPPEAKQLPPPTTDFNPDNIIRQNIQMCIPDWSTKTPTHDATDIPETELFPSEAPRTVRDMLIWMAGLQNPKHQDTLTQCITNAFKRSDDVYSDLTLPVNGADITAKDVIDILQLAATFAASVLNSIAPKWRMAVSSVTSASKDPDCCALLCQLRDYVYACCHQLTFLKSQCSRNESEGGWQDCQYGHAVSPQKSPLQDFLTDAPDSKFETHPFDPCNICLKSRVKMGFREEHLPKTQQTGKDISTILSPTCGGEDPLLTLTSYLTCITRRTPRTTGELVSFFHNFGNSLYKPPSGLSKLGSALSSQHDHCPDWDRLKDADFNAVKGVRGSATPNSIHDKDHPNTLSSLLGCGIDNANCPQHMKPITHRAYALYSKAFTHHYLGWTAYLADRLWESLEKLHYDLEKLQCHDSKSKPLHQCDKAMPLLYSHGLTPPEGTLQSSLTCSGLIYKLEQVVAGKPIASLITAMDTFLYCIRAPFLYTALTLWLTATLYILHSLLYRMDVLRIRSHLLTFRISHLIDVKALLAGSRKMLSLYKDVDYFDDDFHS
ncbi:Ribosome-binding protein 1 [Babesia ovata]|uniref:Ribosome-binding protein 1 n=1 Tax=Babesia ovata TaxID=189622 RepID=A0A2H6KG33_9APIC|nr:Ribosome-binding protein 1 [Babesia ovata]GBE61951.1 Ribosome-binding protein 1 [Babesia ovata]